MMHMWFSLDWDTIRWFNAVLSAVALALLTMGAITQWDNFTPRLKRVVPWVLVTYAIIAYGSGELAATTVSVPPGLRVSMMLLDLVGLVGALLFNLATDDES